MGTCPNCGVAVAAGYLRCPKCQAALPAPRSKRATFRDEAMAGGTSIEPLVGADGGGGVRASWIVALVLLLFGAGIAMYFATRGGAEAKTPEATPDDEDVVEGDDDDTAEPPAIEPDQPTTRAATRPTGEPRAYTASQVMKRIDDALRAERLWAKVTSDDDVLVIESSLCDQPGVMDVLKGEVDGLRAAGFATVRCQSPNGRVEFESGI